MGECFACTQEALEHVPPHPESILLGETWRVAHAFDTSLEGWLVLLPRRHVLALHDLTRKESTELGVLLRTCSLALQELTGCLKTYVMQFAEADGFAHLHVHLVPRMDWFGESETGPRVFSLLGQPPDRALSYERRCDLAAALNRLMALP